MEDLKTYKQNIKKMFYISVKKDLDKWSANYSNYSINYTDKNGYNSFLKITEDYLYLNDVKISHFKFIELSPIKIPINFKVWSYYKKIKKHFKNIENNKKNKNDIDILKRGLSTIEEKYLKEIRREKLIQLKK
jgi:hypothetical protein